MEALLRTFLAELRAFLRPLTSIVEDADPFGVPPAEAAAFGIVRDADQVRLDRFLLLLADAGIDPVAQLGELDVVRGDVGRIADSIDALSGDVPTSVRELRVRIEEASDLYVQLRRLLTRRPPNPAVALDPEAASRAFLDRMLVAYLDRRGPGWLAAAQVLGIARPAIPGIARPADVDLDRIDRLLSDPAAVLAETWGWDAPFDPDDPVPELDLLLEIDAALGRLGIETSVEIGPPTPDRPADDPTPYVAIPLVGVGDASGGASVEARLFVPAAGGLAATLAADGDWRTERSAPPWSLSLDGSFEAARVPVVTVARDGEAGVTFAGGTPADAAFRADLRRAGRFDVLAFGEMGGVSASGVSLSAWFDAEGELTAGLSAGLEGGTVRIGGVEADGFLARMLPAKGIEAPFALSGGFDTEGGLHLDGNVGLSFDRPLTVDLGGVLRLDMLHVSARLGTAGIDAEVAITGAASLGPFRTTIERVGLRGALARLSAAPEDGFAGHVAARVGAGDARPGMERLGDLAAAAGFRPPTGIGLMFELGPVGGGGFVSFDEPARRYAGALALKAESIGLSAFGVVVTRMPDGADGFSLLAFVRGEFAPVPLGFGFTLDAVGGLFGINRGIDAGAVFEAVRAGTIGDLLSPEDPVRDAPRLLEQAERMFPLRSGRHVFGPTLRLGWGAPAEIVTLDLALALTLPEPLRVLLMGRVRAALPTPEVGIISLNIDVAGVLDLSAGTLEAEGRLVDSTYVGIPITGGFALRTSWGGRAGFAFSVGGLHPGFVPPEGFPLVPRAGVSLAKSRDFSLQLAGYFAITSNTLQLGAQVDLMARVSKFGLSFQAGFDALIVFDPFSLDAELRASARIFARGRTLMKLSVRARLTGPNPWHVRGKASFEIFWVDVDIPFDKQFGRAEDVPAKRLSAERLLEAAARAAGNWIGAPSARFVLAPDAAALDPSQPIVFSQKDVPFALTLDHLGGREIDGPVRFDVTGLRLGGAAQALGPSPTEAFAPAQFTDLDEAARLAAPAFDRLPSGVSAAPDAVVTIGPVADDARRRVVRIDARPGGPAISAEQPGWSVPDWFVAERQAVKRRLIAVHEETWRAGPPGSDMPDESHAQARERAGGGPVHRSSEAP